MITNSFNIWIAICCYVNLKVRILYILVLLLLCCKSNSPTSPSSTPVIITGCDMVDACNYVEDCDVCDSDLCVFYADDCGNLCGDGVKDFDCECIDACGECVNC